MTHSPKPEQVDAFASRTDPAITMSAQKSSETPVGAALPRPTPAFATAVAAVPLLQPTLCESVLPTWIEGHRSILRAYGLL